MFKLRTAVPQDALKLSVLAEKIFRDTFSEANTSENMDIYVKSAFGEAIQRREICDPRRHFVIAESDSDFIGYYQIYDGISDPCVHGEKPIELVRMYVDFKWHGQGVAKTLMDHALVNARGMGYKTIWLGVWEKNFRAQKFYEKWNFKNVGSHIFMHGLDPQNDFIFARSI